MRLMPKSKDPITTNSKEWAPYVEEYIKTHREDIDVILADHLSFTAVIKSLEMDIPMVINAPAPFDFYMSWGFYTPDMKKATSCCGMVCIRGVPLQWIIETCLTKMLDYRIEFFRHRYDVVWMMNSFFGLEPATCLPPNIKLIGTIDKKPEALMENLKSKDLTLYNWLEDALAKNEDVVYVSLGSMCRWQPWSVNTMY